MQFGLLWRWELTCEARSFGMRIPLNLTLDWLSTLLIAREPYTKLWTCAWASEGIFPGVVKKIFSRVATIVIFHFPNSETKRKTFFY